VAGGGNLCRSGKFLNLLEDIMKKLLLASAFGLALASCEQPAPPTGMDTITAEDLHTKIEILASDEFEGRAPSSPGEVKTINYLRDEFIKYGLEPGNGDSWFQDVPLVDITASTNQEMVFGGGSGEDITLTYLDDYVALTRRVVEDINIAEAEMVTQAMPPAMTICLTVLP
jgi:hypothetical protein